MVANLFVLLGGAAPAALIITLWVMAQISRRFGEVTHRPPLYRGFYVALGLMVVTLLVRLLAVGQNASDHDGGNQSLSMMLHDISMAASMTVAVFVAWRYWGWLVFTRDGEDDTGHSHDRQGTVRND